MSKRIILLLDGTWNDADAGPADTNIVRMREIIARSLDPMPTPGAPEAFTPHSSPEQFSVTARNYSGARAMPHHLVFYERGVGTSGFLDDLTGGAFGVGLARNVRRAYIFLSRYYEEGDEIFIFGFSRGSYTARSLAGYVGAVGLLTRDRCSPENESKAWTYYRTNVPDRLPSVENEIRKHIHPAGRVRINCLGVFDTVGAMGVPVPLFTRENRDLFGFHDVSLSAISDVNLHALAVDEHREAFQPTVWRQDKFLNVESSKTSTEQVWFAGSHGDIGGGWLDEEERKANKTPALDDITLDWMLRRVLFHCHDFPVKVAGGQAWPKIAPEWALAPQHEARRSFYRLRPFALRSIANRAVHTRWGRFESNVCHDRHASPVGEMVHLSVIERIGRPVWMGGSRSMNIYAPRNLLAALDARNDTPISIVDWSGEKLDDVQAKAAIRDAMDRLRSS